MIRLSPPLALVPCLVLALACGPAPRARAASAASAVAPAAPAPEDKPTANEQRDLALVASATAGPATKHLPTIAITRREVRLLGDSAFTLPTPDASTWEHGMPATVTAPAGPILVKRNGPNDLLLAPLAGWLANVHDSHDVSLIVDAAIPYRLLVEVLFTCAQANLDTFHLVVTHEGQPAEIVVRAPHVDPKTLSMPALTALVVGEGVSLKSAGGNVAPGCRETGPGIAVPHANGSVDVAALRACLQSIGGSTPAPLQAGIVAASPSIPFSEIVATLDALRASGITDVSFGLAR